MESVEEEQPGIENRTFVEYENNFDYKTALLIWKVVPPVLIIIGTCGNVLSIVILTSRTIRKSTTVIYFIFLTFSDLAVLYTGLLRQWIIYLFDLDIRQLSELACKTHTWLVYISLDFSAWILIAVTLERIIAVWCPYNKKHLCKRQNAFILITGIFIAVIGLNAHFLYGMVHLNVGGEITKCSFINSNYARFINTAWSWIDLCAFCVIPFTVIVIGNCLILLKVAKRHRKSGSIRSSAPCSKTGPRVIDNPHLSMTAILITLNTVFLITTLPVSIYNIGHAHWSSSKDPVALARLELWWAVVNMLMYTNNAVNFLLYSLSGSQFRKEVKRILCGIYTLSNLFPTRASDALLEENEHELNNTRTNLNNQVNSNKISLNHELKRESVPKPTYPTYIVPNSNVVSLDNDMSNVFKHDSFLSEDELAVSQYNEELETRAPIAGINETNRVSYVGDTC